MMTEGWLMIACAALWGVTCAALDWTYWAPAVGVLVVVGLNTLRLWLEYSDAEEG